MRTFPNMVDTFRSRISAISVLGGGLYDVTLIDVARLPETNGSLTVVDSSGIRKNRIYGWTSKVGNTLKECALGTEDAPEANNLAELDSVRCALGTAELGIINDNLAEVAATGGAAQFVLAEALSAGDLVNIDEAGTIGAASIKPVGLSVLSDVEEIFSLAWGNQLLSATGMPTGVDLIWRLFAESDNHFSWVHWAVTPWLGFASRMPTNSIAGGTQVLLDEATGYPAANELDPTVGLPSHAAASDPDGNLVSTYRSDPSGTNWLKVAVRAPNGLISHTTLTSEEAYGYVQTVYSPEIDRFLALFQQVSGSDMVLEYGLGGISAGAWVNTEDTEFVHSHTTVILTNDNTEPCNLLVAAATDASSTVLAVYAHQGGMELVGIKLAVDAVYMNDPVAQAPSYSVVETFEPVFFPPTGTYLIPYYWETETHAGVSVLEVTLNSTDGSVDDMTAHSVWSFLISGDTEPPHVVPQVEFDSAYNTLRPAIGIYVTDEQAAIWAWTAARTGLNRLESLAVSYVDGEFVFGEWCEPSPQNNGPTWIPAQRVDALVEASGSLFAVLGNWLWPTFSLVEVFVRREPSVVGVLQSSGDAGETKTVALLGQVAGGFSGLTPGAKQYLQDDLTLSEERTELQAGIALSATTVKLFDQIKVVPDPVG